MATRLLRQIKASVPRLAGAFSHNITPVEILYFLLDDDMDKYYEIKKLIKLPALLALLAEREGFEPSRRVNAYTLSKRAPSATRPPLQSSLVLTNECWSAYKLGAFS